MEEVLWHSATWRFLKSSFVKMPRLPTMRVMGSQFISTKFRRLLELSTPGCSVVAMEFFLSSVSMRSIACRESRTGMAPFRFFVYGRIRDSAEGADHPAVTTNNSCGKAGAWGFVHEGHELVGKARHRAAYADSADIRAAADASHPTAFRDVTINHWPPAAHFHQAFGRSVFLGEIGLLVIRAPVATLVYRFPE